MDPSPIDEQQRYEIVVAKGMEVLRSRTTLAVWLSRLNPQIAEGRELPSVACRSARGFLETMAELDRLATGWPPPIAPRREAAADAGLVASTPTPPASDSHAR